MKDWIWDFLAIIGGHFREWIQEWPGVGTKKFLLEENVIIMSAGKYNIISDKYIKIWLHF